MIVFQSLYAGLKNSVPKVLILQIWSLIIFYFVLESLYPKFGVNRFTCSRDSGMGLFWAGCVGINVLYRLIWVVNILSGLQHFILFHNIRYFSTTFYTFSEHLILNRSISINILQRSTYSTHAFISYDCLYILHWYSYPTSVSISYVGIHILRCYSYPILIFIS